MNAIALYKKMGFTTVKKNVLDLGAMLGMGKILMKKDIGYKD